MEPSPGRPRIHFAEIIDGPPTHSFIYQDPTRPAFHQLSRSCTLRQSLSAVAVFDALLPALRGQLRLIESLRDQQLVLLADIRAAVIAAKRGDEVKLVESIPGYGEKTAATIVACVPEDLRSWGKKQKVARKLQAYFGCDPKLCESGQWHVRMSKRGVELALLACDGFRDRTVCVHGATNPLRRSQRSRSD